MTDKENKLQEESQVNSLQAFASVNDIQSLYFKVNYPNGLSTFANYTVPQDRLNQIKEAKRLRNSDLVDRLLNIRKNYTLPIQGVKCKLKKQQKFYDEYVVPLITRFADQWIIEKYTIGEVFSHYGFQNEKTPMYLRLEDPENINTIEFMGFEVFEIRLGSGVKEQIKKLQEQKAIDKLPLYLRKAINKEGYVSDKIILDNTNMYRTSDGKQDYDKYVIPPIIKIAKQINLRNFLLDVDYVNAFASQKASLIHTKCGDKETYKQWDNTKIGDIHNLITNRAPGQAFITTRFDVDIKQVSLDLSQMFDPKKFEESNSDIMNFMGIPIIFIPSKSGELNNSVVVVSLKPFEESIYNDRRIFEDFLKVFFEQINKRNGFSEIPQTIYKRVNFRDDGALLKELEFLNSRGVLSFQDVCLQFNYDPDEQLDKKKQDWQNRNIIAPVFETSQGLSPMLDETVDQKIKIANETKQVTQGGDSNNGLR